MTLVVKIEGVDGLEEGKDYVAVLVSEGAKTTEGGAKHRRIVGVLNTHG